MPSLLRWPLRSVTLVCAMALAALIFVTGSALAHSRRQGHSKTATYRVIVKRPCSLKLRKRHPKRAHVACHRAREQRRRARAKHHPKTKHDRARGRTPVLAGASGSPPRPGTTPTNTSAIFEPSRKEGGDPPAGHKGKGEAPAREEESTGEEEPVVTEEASEEPVEEIAPEERTESPTEEKIEEAPTPTPLSATGEDFADQPSDVLLTYAQAVKPSEAEKCVALSSTGASETFGGAAQGPTPESVRLYLAPGASTMPAQVRCPAETQVKGANDDADGSKSSLLTVAAATPSTGGVLGDPIDPKYLTELPFGTRSFWIQPWRAYMDTWPVSRLIDSLGINFNVTAKQAEDTARLLQESSFKLARIEIGWNSLSYENPSKFKNEASIDEELEALHKHDLRPLILLNANGGEPNPTEAVTLETTEEAPAGATTLTLSPASAEQVIPGRTGFDDLTFGGVPDLLIAALSGDVATLAKPLPKALAAGAHKGATMLYEPFGPPELANGEPNPVFEETLKGWLSYVATISKKAASIFGPEGYDLEIWNELSFGSQYLNEEHYYSPARETGEGSVEKTLLDETVDYVRNQANGISSGVGVTNGFASENPFASGANQPVGITAISKHLYAGGIYFPIDEVDSSIKPLNALGEDEFSTSGTAGSRIYTPLFKPDFKAELPEYYLSGLQTETVIRNLAPTTTSIYGGQYGRYTTPEGGDSAPEVWMTEYNLQHSSMLAVNPQDPDRWAGKATAAQAEHLQAEILLRSLVSMINKGMSREYFYAATGAGWNLISEQFMAAVNAAPSTYPGRELGGETTESFRRMMEDVRGPGPEGSARQLTLRSIAQEGEHAQFAGDGTLGAPNLYDREMLAVLPFQASPTRFVIPVYVMSENLTTINKPGEAEDSIHRFDLPNENFRITLGNLPETKAPPSVSAYDPISDEATPARLIARRGGEATFEIAATDYPRLLEIGYPTTP